jgi:putative Holliday junction resolvase
LAVSGGAGSVATALRTVDRREEGEGAAIEAIVDECEQRDVRVIVVGWPLQMDGKEGRAVDRVRTFIDRLERGLGRAFDAEGAPEIRRWDERMTSSEVNTALRETDMSRKRRDAVVDKLAATRILQSFLDSEQSTARQHAENADAKGDG